MKSISVALRKKARNIRFVLLDVDGVLTDGGIVMDDRGKELKRFDVRDGQGIKLLLEAGLEVGFITGRFSKVVIHRARDLGVARVYQRAANKLEIYNKIKREIGLKDEEIAYIGDDIADIPVLRRVGLALTVKNGWAGLKQIVDYVSVEQGGCGAVRDMAELILKAQAKWRATMQRYYRI